MNLHVTPAARWKVLNYLWYSRRAAFVLMVGGLLAGVWYLSKDEDTGWLVPYTLAAGITWAGLGYVIGRIDRK